MKSKSMSVVKLSQMLQDTLLRAGRAGPLVWLTSGLWLVVLALLTWVLPAQYAARANDRQALLQAHAAQKQAAMQNIAPGGSVGLPEQEVSQHNALQFKALLAGAPLPESAQQTLFALAKRWELELPQGQYKQSCEDSGTWCSYRMQLPVVGSYTAVRGFVQDALHSLPSLALEGAVFKRDAAATDDLEVALRWTLYQARLPAAGAMP